MQEGINQMAQTVGSYLPNIIAAIVILIVGWIVALIVAGVIKGLLKRTNLDNRIANWVAGGDRDRSLPVEDWIGTAVFWIVMLFVLVAFFQTLHLTVITQPLNQLLSVIFAYIPKLLGAAVLLLLAWLIATVLKMVVTRVLQRVGLDDRVAQQSRDPNKEQTEGGASASGAGQTTSAPAAGQQRRVPLSQTIGEAVYWLVFLLFLPAILDALGLQGILGPVSAMVNELLAFLPNLLAAALILAVGWFVARIIQRIVTNLLAAAGVDRLSDRAGMANVMGRQRLSGLIGLVVYVLILIPVLIAALNALQLEAITRPASEMLNDILTAIPNIFAAALVLVIAYVVGRLVAGLISNVLAGVGLNTLPQRMGMRQNTVGDRTLSDIAGQLVLVAIMLFATMEAARLLGFVLLATLIGAFITFLAQIIMGLIIFAIGLWLADLAARTIRATGVQRADLLATAARAAIMVLAAAMALQQMNLADEIINLAFGLLLGAIAVATAIAFGLGGRDIAHDQLQRWVARAEQGGQGPQRPGPGPAGPRQV